VSLAPKLFLLLPQISSEEGKVSTYILNYIPRGLRSFRRGRRR